MAISYQFGASAETDAFFVAYIIPYAFYSVIGMSLATVVVPIYTNHIIKGDVEEAWRVANLSVNHLMILMTGLSIVGVLMSSHIALVLGGGFSSETLKITSDLISIMMPAIVFMSLGGLLGGVLNANNIFGPPVVGPALMNIFIIVAAFISFKNGIYCLAVGTLVGSFLFLLVLLPSLKYVGYKHKLVLDFKETAIKKILKSVWPIIFISSITSLYKMVDMHFASSMVEGSISSLNYAIKLMQLPLSLFVAALSTALYPTLSRHAVSGDLKNLCDVLRKGLKSVALVAMPSAVGLLVLREPIIMLLFKRGAFDLQAYAMTSSALLFYSIALVGFGLNFLILRGYFAMQNYHVPLVIGFISLVIKYVSSLFLINHFQHSGLALSTLIAITAYLLFASFLLQRKLLRLFDRSFVVFVIRVICASLFMGIIINNFDRLFQTTLSTETLMLIVRISLGMFLGVIIYIWTAMLLRIAELENIFKQIYSIVSQGKNNS